MTTGYNVEYSECGNEVCVIPKLFIPSEEFFKIVKMYNKLGYRYWLQADERRGYLFSKKKVESVNK